MDPQIDLPDLTEDLEANIDDLETALQPLLSTPLHTTTSTLPLLDKAKAQVLTAYAIESLLFSALQASGIPAKDHAIFAELARLKTYFAKIKTIGATYEQPKTRLDVGAAARFIKAGLAGNDKLDEERLRQQMKERAKAAVKLAQLEKERQQKTFDQVEEGRKQAELARQADEVRKRKAEAMEGEDDDDDDDDEDEEEEGEQHEGEVEEDNHVETENEDFYGSTLGDKAAALTGETSPASDSAPTPKSAKKSKKERKEERKRRKLASGQVATPSTDESSPKARKHAKKMRKRLQKMESVGGQKRNEELVIPDRNQHAPKSRSQTFSALLDGSFVESRKEGKVKKGKK